MSTTVVERTNQDVRQRFAPGAKRRERVDKGMQIGFLLATVFPVIVLAALLITIWLDGWNWLSWDFLSNPPSRTPEIAGIEPAIWGTIWLIGLTAVFSFIVGVGAAIYLEEYAERTWFNRILQTNISNLAGVPSVVYGLLGLGILVNMLALGRNVLTGALTLGLLILPIIIIASQEALLAVPLSLRQAAYAVGATKWQVLRSHVLPAAGPGILTGTILALSRAIGETAPVVVAGAASYLLFRPESPFDQYMPLPVLIYTWTSRPQEEFQELAAAAIIVLLVLLLAMNALAVYLRQRLGNERW
ncbi:MAG: phosphate ABC transporter permease PstA [Chloroflexota bacterium]|nr:phosphate ABC transporter permease PstA [Chloroflexota bacterium]